MGTFAFLRLIGWLKLTLLRRHFSRNTGNLVALGCSGVVMLMLCLFGGAALYLLCRSGGAETRDIVFAWAAWILSALWLSAPLMQVDLTRSLDLNGLRLFPVSRARMTLAVLLDSMLSPQGLLLLPAVLVLIVCLTLRLGELPFVLLSLLLLAACLLSLGQAITLWANRLLASRRYADSSLVVGFVVLIAVQLTNLVVQSRESLALPGWLTALVDVLRNLGAPLAAWLFPGLSARAAAAACAGNASEAIALYGMLTAQAGLCLILASLAAQQFYSGELESAGVARQRAGGRVWRGGRGLLRGVTGALFERERIYLYRDPILKMLFIQTLFWAVYIFIVMLVLRLSAGELLTFGESYGRWLVLATAAMLGYAESGVLFNKFGYEGSQLTFTLLSPVPRETLLRAKSAFFLLHFATFNGLLILVIAKTLSVPLQYAVAALLIVVVNTVLVDAVGNFVSIMLPFTYRRQGSRMRPVMPQPGCGYLLTYAVVFHVANLITLPTTLAVAGGVISYGWAGLAAAAVVCAVMLWLAWRYALPWASRLLESREARMLEMLAGAVE